MALDKRDVDKDKTVGNIKSVDTDSNIVLINTEKDNNIVEDFYFDPYNEKIYKRFVKTAVRLVRMSQEYDKYIKYLSLDQNLNNDVLMGNITSSDVELEFHHYPFTLYDIVDIITSSKLDNGEKITTISIAEVTLQEHFNNLVGLARLTKTNHELAHSGALFVPLTAVFGDVNEFINKYYDHIKNDHIETYNKLVDITNKEAFDNSQVFTKVPTKD